MAPRPHCAVCAHPDVTAINADLTAGRSVRDIAGRYEGVSKSRVQQHKTDCVAPVVGGRAALERIQLDAVQASAGREQQRGTVRILAERELDRAQELAALGEKVARTVLANTIGPDGLLVDPDDGDMLQRALSALKAAVDARGGGTLKWAELVGKVDGSIKTGSQTLVLVQDGRVVHPELGRVMDTVMAALTAYPEAGAAVQRALEEMAGEAGGVTR